MTRDDFFESFKWTTLEEAIAGALLREPVLDALNWFDLEESLLLGERALRELHSEALIYFAHSRSGERVEPDELDRMFASRTWTRGFHDDEFGDVEHRQTVKGQARHAELL